MRRCGAGCEGAGQVEGRLVKLVKLVARAAEALAEVHRVRAVADEAGGCRGPPPERVSHFRRLVGLFRFRSDFSV